MQRIQVGNKQFDSVLFIIPIVIDIHSHRFKIFTLVSEIHENIDLVFGMKNIFELEVIINSQESCFSFLNRLIPFFAKEQKLIKIEAPFVDEISGLVIVKILDRKVQKYRDANT